ncbi:hypothetical protein H3T61_06250 [Gilliamella sp. B14384H2]|uniref:hypothetical protein n=1 Tax=unclassified Gilliamella TaxID=2685620 RepID=UPI0018DE3449|nr:MULTISPECIES: hypothetical protein [unclassified Gilliamella]MBI0037823.1 hypothetical protein [Gilliamella sp. B14384G10]MBI0039818.1 hypothetical protein [Gilliamella sp. B14384G7]MBI0051658.1 hypothetical protein [Gilliamella sp. B14384G13]MBI0054110.1 hypothetical protein [Gilliamella sp. B14384H2]
MKTSLKDKLNLFRARDYATKLNGISSFNVSLLHDNEFIWHRKMLIEINKIDNDIKKIFFNLPINRNVLAREVESILNIKKDIMCNMFYSGNVSISFYVESFSDFILSLFSINRTYDFSLVFTSPDRVIALSDNEYDIHLYYIHK